MRIFTYTVAIAAVAVSMSLFYQILFQQPIVVKLRSVAVGGKITRCWASMQQEAAAKSKSCNHVIIGSGVSAYAMAMALPRACIKPSAVIKIHRPYHEGYKAVAIGSRWHNYYFGRIKPSAVNYFKARGGMQRSGFANAAMMISVPAANTGLPLCKAL